MYCFLRFITMFVSFVAVVHASDGSSYRCSRRIWSWRLRWSRRLQPRHDPPLRQSEDALGQRRMRRIWRLRRRIWWIWRWLRWWLRRLWWLLRMNSSTASCACILCAMQCITKLFIARCLRVLSRRRSRYRVKNSKLRVVVHCISIFFYFIFPIYPDVVYITTKGKRRNTDQQVSISGKTNYREIKFNWLTIRYPGKITVQNRNNKCWETIPILNGGDW